jgi:hypothetical protein
MAYTVTWTSEFSDDVAAAWLAGDSTTRDLITKVTHLLDQRLSKSPLTLGRPLLAEPGVYLWIASGLPRHVEICYEVSEPDRRVRVLRMTIR